MIEEKKKKQKKKRDSDLNTFSVKDERNKPGRLITRSKYIRDRASCQNHIPVSSLSAGPVGLAADGQRTTRPLPVSSIQNRGVRKKEHFSPSNNSRSCLLNLNREET